MGCTSRQSWTEGLLPVGLGLGEPVPVGLGEGEPEGLLLGLLLGVLLGVLLGLDEALLLGLDEALLLGLAVALLVALGVDVALLVALGVLLGVALLVAFAVALALDFGVLDDETEAASRTIADWPAGTARTAEVAAGGWPHTLGADAPTVLASVAFAVLASAAVLPRRPMLEVTMAAPATMPKADDADRADFMAAPSSPWSSPSRPRVSSDSSDRPCQETIPCCRSSTPALRCPSREDRTGLPQRQNIRRGKAPGWLCHELSRYLPPRAEPPGGHLCVAFPGPALAGDHQAALVWAPSITGGWAVVTGITWPVDRLISARWPG